MSESFLIQSKITSQVIQAKNKTSKAFPYSTFTEYKIRIMSDDKFWFIKKRYKDFSEFHSKVLKTELQRSLFPEKKLFPLNMKVINERIILFDKYLNLILSQINSLILSKKFEFVSDFIELRKQGFCFSHKDNRKLFKKNVSANSFEIKHDKLFINNLFGSKIGSVDDLNSKYRSKTTLTLPQVESDKFVEKFLNKINNDKDSISLYCQEFYHEVSKNFDFLTVESIFLLFFGNHIYKGLFFFSGKVTKNPIGAYASLDLICSLLDIEINISAETYIYAFRLGNFRCINQLNVNQYYYSKKSQYLDKCFMLFRLWAEKRDNDKLSEYTKNIFRDDQNLVRCFETFIVSRNL